MSVMPSVSYQYQVGGVLSPDSSVYIQRQADQELYEGLKKGEICYVLSSRQMGKSSLRVRIMQRLQNEGFTCASIDMSVIGAKDGEPEKWYYGVTDILVSRFDLAKSFDLDNWWSKHHSLSAAQRLLKFIEEVLLKFLPQKIIILIDEIDSLLSLDFGVEDFWAVIRQCYNRRAEQADYSRLTFALMGAAAPADLIQYKQRTPFSIGQAIQLNSFRFEEVQPLAEGLAARAHNPQAVLKAILSWTRGQPFLTQKLCQFVLNNDYTISAGEEDAYIENLVQVKIIDNWSFQDQPEHFRLLQDRILKNPKRVVQLLGLYQIIIHRGELEANQSLGIRHLLLSGLVFNQQGKLKIDNPIYEIIFNLDWVNHELSNHRPYSIPLANWLKSHRRENSYLLTGKTLQNDLNWAEGKCLTSQDYQFLSASQNLDRKKMQQQWELDRKQWRLDRKRFKQQKRTIFIAALMVMATLFGAGVWRLGTSCSYGEIWNGRECVLKISIGRLSSGEKILFSEDNPDLEIGAIAFSRAEYSRAQESFKKARDITPNAPEAWIYLNNSIAREAGEPHVIAVALPVSRRGNIAKEILRGVADAQTQFNNSRRGADGGLIEVVIVDDNDNPKTAARIARHLARNKNLQILGMIGHASSNVSQRALNEYEKAGLAMISPTSGSSLLRGDTFFRTSPSDEAAGEKLARYLIDTLETRRALVFFDGDSSHSQSLEKAFEDNFGAVNVELADLAEPDLDIEYRIRESLANQVQAVLLFPSIEKISTTITIARYVEALNAKLPSERRVRLLGGDTLYTYETLNHGGTAIEGLVIAVPWFPKDSFLYAKDAEKRWFGPVSWRTASSFDAAQALIQAISNLDPEIEDISKARQEILEQLKAIELSPSSPSGAPLTSGEWLAFDEDGERRVFNEVDARTNTPFLARVTRNRGNSPRALRFVFELLPGQ